MRIQPLQALELNPELMLRRFVDESGAENAFNHASLDWPQLLEALARYCRSPLSAESLRGLPLLDNPSEIARRYAELQECFGLYEKLDPLPSLSLEALDEILMRVDRSATLSPLELLTLARALNQFHALRRYFRVRREDLPLLWAYAEDLCDELAIERQLFAAFDAEAQLQDNASPELARLREQKRRLSESLRRRIEAKLAQEDFQELLQDKFYTQREGRYVLPIKAQHRSRCQGIVHATSASGQTVFVEPADLVELNNALRVADFAIVAEEERILESLSRLLFGKTESLRASLRRAIYLEGLDAITRFSLDCRCHIPDLSDGEIEIYQGRHPLLALRKHQNPEAILVANDLLLLAPQSALVISGANAGGKTVQLKTVGLFALMVKAGLPLSAGQSSCFPIFDAVYDDIGDAQSIDRNISTFSAHIRKLAQSLENASASSLFLLDEPFSGTDPEHASALSIALLEQLRALGARVIVTTHYENVKAFALNSAWTETASVAFDLDLLKATYKLQLGQAGTSSAFEIALQHGLDPKLIAAAKQHYQGHHATPLEEALGRIESLSTALERERELLEERRSALDKERQETEALRQKIREKVLESVDLDLARANEQVRKIRQQLKKLRQKSYQAQAQQDEAAREALALELKALEEAQKAEASTISKLKVPQFKPLSEAQLVVGREVFVAKYRKRGKIVTRSAKSALVQVGPLHLQCALDELGEVDDQSPKPEKAKTIPQAPQTRAPLAMKLDESVLVDDKNRRPLLPQVPENCLDLRSLTLDDALERCDFFIQSLLLRDAPMGYIIHGHGTGILKAGIRRQLKQWREVVEFRPGGYYEGGDGVTLFWLQT